MRRISSPPDIGRPAHTPARRGASWVQTERASHEAWSRLVIRKPVAAAVLHTLVARMGDQNAVVVSQKTLAALIGVTDRTIRNAIQVLVAENWVQVVRLNGPGTVSAYVVNSAVAWGQPRYKLHLAAFTAAVVADAADQEAITLEHRDLRKIPMLYPGERQLPTGPGEDPPSQPAIEGMEPDLPSLQAEQLEDAGQKRLLED